MLQQVITNSLETDEKREHLIKDLEVVRKNQRETTEQKSTTANKIHHLTANISFDLQSNKTKIIPWVLIKTI